MKSKGIAAVIFILSIILSIGFYIFRDFFKETVSLGLLGIFLANLVSSASVVPSGPAFLTVIAGSTIYPPILVAFIASFGSALGDIVGYLLGVSGRKLAIHKLHKKAWFITIERYFERFGVLFLFLFAFLPNPFFDSIGIIAGIFAYSPIKFFLIVFFGRFLRYLLLAHASSLF